MNAIDVDRAIGTRIESYGASPAAFVLGSSVLVIAFLVALLLEWRKALRGERPDWSGPILRLICFTALLAFYAGISKHLIALVSSFGSLQGIEVADQGKSIFAARAEAFSNATARLAEEDLTFAQMAAASFVESLLHVLTWSSYTFAAAIVQCLKVVQKVMLSTLLTFGPIMIGFASIPGLTSRYLAAWFLAVIEVTAWGLTGNIFLKMMNEGFRGTSIDPDLTPNLAEHVVFNIVYALSFTLIPVVTATILRGGSAAGIAQGALSFAQGLAAGGAGALAASRLARASPSQLKDAAASFVPSFGGSKGGAQSRAGDRASSGDDGGAPPRSTGATSDDARDARRSAFARDGAIRKHERSKGEE